MPEQKMPDVLAKLLSQMRNTSELAPPHAPVPPVNHFVFQIGQGGVVQFVLGGGVLHSAPEGGLKDA